MAHDVFISYSTRDPESKDRKVADAICSSLENQKIRCWLAYRDANPSEEYGAEIIKAIGSCRIFILIFSFYANESQHVRKEVERAVSKEKIILPFRIEESLPTDAMEYCLSNIHWLDALTPPMEEHISTLVRTVKSILDKLSHETETSSSIKNQKPIHEHKQTPVTHTQNLIVPAYFRPGKYWADLLNNTKKIAFIILNPETGPGIRENPGYLSVVRSAQQSGIRVLGYIHTQYALRSVNDVFSDVDKYRLFYSLDGIFLDQVSAKTAMLSYYRKIVTHIKSHTKNLVVLNFGTLPDESFVKLGDILCVYNGSYDDYTKVDFMNPDIEWIHKYPSDKFMHIVYGASEVKEMNDTINLSQIRNTGYLYVTDGTLPNPYENLPTYWQDELEKFE